MSREYHVLSSAPGDPEIFEDMFEVLVDLADRDLLFNPPYHKEASDTLVEEVWLEEGQKAMMTLVDDFEAPARYFVVEAGSSEIVTEVSARLREHLPLVAVEELRDEASQGLTTDPGVLVRLAVGSIGSFDSASFEILGLGLRHSSEHVRYQAATGAALTQWPEFCSELASLSRNDPDEDVREMAGRALEACQRDA